jgi:hypothetical protein
MSDWQASIVFLVDENPNVASAGLGVTVPLCGLPWHHQAKIEHR